MHRADAALTEHLRRRCATVHTTTEPSHSALGRFTRAHADRIRGRALACLVAADRYHHLHTEIQPHLAAGDIVVCDRYLASTLVLQRLDDVPEPFLLALNTDIRLPDLAVLLTAPPEVIATRLARRGAHHRFEEDSDTPGREIALYRDAARTLERLSVQVLILDTSTLTPTETAARIAATMASRDTSVGRHNGPDEHTVTPCPQQPPSSTPT
ncbi:dTMP kinase [Streptomyces paromomycinus]|uniref:Thymidylate kinase n=1 Tax=Streptomyces paromomycinus TaxID=92743 RepID=A0A401W5F3_STREY|nr:dTMP kinase [Streptomyces paromomycinus]GCD44587.1 thymidylate kinase [Streptomyces paromomycinus]